MNDGSNHGWRRRRRQFHGEQLPETKLWGGGGGCFCAGRGLICREKRNWRRRSGEKFFENKKEKTINLCSNNHLFCSCSHVHVPAALDGVDGVNGVDGGGVCGGHNGGADVHHADIGPPEQLAATATAPTAADDSVVVVADATADVSTAVVSGDAFVVVAATATAAAAAAAAVQPVYHSAPTSHSTQRAQDRV